MMISVTTIKGTLHEKIHWSFMNISVEHTSTPFYSEGESTTVTRHSKFNNERARREGKGSILLNGSGKE
jgi:hypothetical protein